MVADNSNTAARQDPAFTENRLVGIPGGRWGHPDDFKGPAVFLASDASTYVTGEILVVDGVSVQYNFMLSL
jgi:2-deoxy-D-gluconate 3-dehydrogenase